MELPIGAVIAQARRAKNMTQENLADAVGVSTAAVSKWETAASYPDITLLSPIARALGLTVDDLVGFHAALDADTLRRETERLAQVFETQGAQAGQAACAALLHEYPASGKLKLSIGNLYFRFLAGILSDAKDTESAGKEFCAQALALFEEGEKQADNPSDALSARLMQVSLLMSMGETGRAEELLDSFPKEHIPLDQLYPSLYLLQERLEDAERAYQQSLLNHVYEAGMALSGLSTVARRQGDPARAARMAALYEALDDLFGLPSIAPLHILMFLAAERGDLEEAAGYFETYIERILRLAPDKKARDIFSLVNLDGQDAAAHQQGLYKLLLRNVQTEEPFVLLKGNPRYAQAVERLRRAAADT